MRIEGARIVEYRAPLARTLKPPIYFPPEGRFCVTWGRDKWARRSRSVTTVASSGSGRDSLSLNQWYSHSMGTGYSQPSKDQIGCACKDVVNGDGPLRAE